MKDRWPFLSLKETTRPPKTKEAENKKDSYLTIQTSLWKDRKRRLGGAGQTT